jgi:hypothetical protein
MKGFLHKFFTEAHHAKKSFVRKLLLSLLLVAPPAFALSYSGSAVLDWSTLTFRGISMSEVTAGSFDKFKLREFISVFFQRF